MDKIPIKINGRHYYFENIISGGEYVDYCHTQFYERGPDTKKRVIKKKYWLFGPVVSDELVDVQNYNMCFKTYREISEDVYFDVDAIKITEDKYFKWKNIKMGNLEL
jgi:hypothetical protein